MMIEIELVKQNGGVLLLSPKRRSNLAQVRNNSKSLNRTLDVTFKEVLEHFYIVESFFVFVVASDKESGPHLLVCDEGHRLKNDRTIISITMWKIQTKRRIFLTGKLSIKIRNFNKVSFRNTHAE
jgi:hypothetical protein